MDEILANPEDEHALQERLREELQQMRAMGQGMPEDLVEVEAWLSAHLAVPDATVPPHLRRR